MTERIFKWCRDHDVNKGHPSISFITEFSSGGTCGKIYKNVKKFQFNEHSITISIFKPLKNRDFLRRYIQNNFLPEDYQDIEIKRENIQKICWDV